MTKFTPEVTARIVARVELGVSFADSAAAVGVKLPTAKGWLSRGRKEDSGRCHDFAAAVERAREMAGARLGPMDEDELARTVSELARAGGVQAARLRWEMLLADRRRANARSPKRTAKDPLAELDELARRRVRRES